MSKKIPESAALKEEEEFEAKREEVKNNWQAESEGLLFEDFLPPRLRGIEFLKKRVQVTWICGSGAQHKMQVFDWEVAEIQRKFGDAEALKLIRKALDLSTHATRLFLGNLKAHPNRFTIVGLWYPKRNTGETQGQLF